MSVVVTEPVVNGLVVLHTSLGDISIELWPRETPKAVRNFVQLCLEGYYDGATFGRVLPGFIAQTGDSGSAGECIYDEGTFEDEFNARLKFSRRGLVAMANTGRNSNQSQFFFTLDSTPELQNQNTIFGRVGGDTLFNVLKFNDSEITPGTQDKPVYPAVIKSAEVVDNPFDDIEPRITAKERKEQNRAKKEMKIERAKEREQGKRKGTKNVALLSFGADPEEPIDPAFVNTKFKSSHDALDDPRLRKEVKDDRGTSVNVPLSMLKRDNEEGDKSVQKRRKVESSAASTSQASSSKLEVAREAKAKATVNPNDKIRAEIAKVQADLKKMSQGEDLSDEEGKKSKKVKRTGPSLLQLEREKYSRGTAASMSSTDAKGKKVRREDEDIMGALESFKSKILEAKSSSAAVSNESSSETKKPEGIWGDNPDELNEEDNDEGWLSHSLVFRKDATLDKHSIDEYSTFDPLSKNTLSLDELKYKADSSSRKYPPAEGDGDRNRDSGGRGGRGGSSRGGSSRNDRGGSSGNRNDRGSGRGNESSRSDDRNDSFGGTQGRSKSGNSWKSDRIGDLA